MPRKRDPRRDEAREIWKRHDGNITNRSIAEQLNVPEKTISAWKSRDKWNVVLQKKKRSTTKARGAPKGNKNAVGNDGGAPIGNQNAKKFGFFSRYMPEETLEIMKQINSSDPADLLWDQIMIQYTAIIRAQKIMLVNDANDLSKEQSQSGWGDSGADKYEVRFAFEKQANFLNAQSRAMSELRALIKQFAAIADENDERKLKLELMRKQIAKLEGSDGEGNDEWIAGLKAVANKRRHQGESHE
jgi:uncharacterized protein YjcR